MRLMGLLALGIAWAGGPAPAAPALSDSARPAAAQAPLVNQAAGNARNAPDSSLSEQAGYKSRADTVLVVKHSFDHRQQIIAGSVIMTCLMLMMVTMNNYNPR